jgi:hypothetical protein
MKTTPFVVTIALLAHGALAADLDETAKAREHFAETYRNVIDQAVVYDQSSFGKYGKPAGTETRSASGKFRSSERKNESIFGPMIECY